jgi:hypothetical protein
MAETDGLKKTHPADDRPGVYLLAKAGGTPQRKPRAMEQRPV